MADTRPDIKLPANIRIDLYVALNAQSGFPAVSVGDQISVQNKKGGPIELTTKATKPIDGDGSNTLDVGNQQFENEVGDSGAFAFSPNIDSTINVRVV